MKVKRKSVVVDAIQYLGEWQPIRDWLNSVGHVIQSPDEPNIHTMGDKVPYLCIHTLEGYVKCRPGNYLIRGIKGELSSCSVEIFEDTYEVIEE